MLETEEVDEDYFTPVSSTSLANVFSKSPHDDTLNDSLKYIPPKPETSKEDLNVERSTECVLACALFCYQWSNNEYKAKGKLGFAILNIKKRGEHTIILYDTNKVNLSQVIISSSFELTVKGNCNISYYDTAQKFWSLYGTEEEIKKICEIFLKLNGKIRHSSTKYKNPPENLNKVEPTNSKRKKDIVEVGSVTDLSVSRQAKISILNRMANMGQSILPAQNVSEPQITDSSDSSEDKSYALVKHKNLKSSNKHSNETKAVSTDIIAPIETYSAAELMPVPSTSLFSSVTTGSTDFTLFLSEQRVCNTELRINFNRLSDKVEQILDKVKILTLSNENSKNPSIHSDITQKLLIEYENKIKCYEEIIKGMDTQYIKEKMLLNITSGYAYNTTPVTETMDDNINNTTNKIITKLCGEIETCHKKLDQLLGINPETEEKILEEIFNLKNIIESKAAEITNLYKSNSAQCNIESKIKILMNETFQNLCENFDDDKQYTGEEVKNLLAATIKKSTVQSLKDAKASLLA